MWGCRGKDHRGQIVRPWHTQGIRRGFGLQAQESRLQVLGEADEECSKNYGINGRQKTRASN